MNNQWVFSTDAYVATFDIVEQQCLLISKQSGKLLAQLNLTSAVDTLQQVDRTTNMSLLDSFDVDGVMTLVFSAESAVWQQKQVTFELHSDHVQYFVTVEGNGQRITDLGYFRGNSAEIPRTAFDQIYAPRFDWFKGQILVPPTADESLGCQQWLSPPPFAYAFVSAQESVFCGVAAEPGSYNFLSFDYTGSQGIAFRLTYEGHTEVNGRFTSPRLVIGFGQTDPNDAIEAYVGWLRRWDYISAEMPKAIPDWWHEPMFCGWGQMRYDYRIDHDGHENGNFINVTFYCTEALYRRYLAEMEANGINPGTIIIDMGWAEQPPFHTPSPKRWQNLRGFIDEQHAKGRKVLLWYTPVVTQGLPDEACMLLDRQPVCPDPTSPAYQAIVTEEVRRMVSDGPDGLNADGFKIDFTQNTPSESGRFTSRIPSFWGLINETNDRYIYPKLGRDRQQLIQTHGDKWGVEILRAYLQLIHDSMKQHKPDSMLITHTPNPYFTEIVDVLRLNDLDGDCQDVLEVMTNRARIARMCSQHWLLDTDNDLMVDKARWRAYIQLQPQLGIPDTYYASAIAHSQERFDESDYALLREVWQTYRDGLAVSQTAEQPTPISAEPPTA